jgi:hypothetical protein
LRPQVLNFNAKPDADKVADDKTEYIHAQTQACHFHKSFTEGFAFDNGYEIVEYRLFFVRVRSFITGF